MKRGRSAGAVTTADERNMTISKGRDRGGLITNHRLFSGILFCLALALQTHARAAVEMRLPALKNYYLDTTLVSNGAAMAVVVAPDAPGYADLAGQVRDAVKKLTGADLPVISDVSANAELEQAGGNRRAMIVLGNISINKVSERLYCMDQLDVDAGWPAKTGTFFRPFTIPWATGATSFRLAAAISTA